ncbi:hypothetical protein [Cellvibrio sp. OA-2007]|uniref:hypothetical protein n=1 Tax=Cellvibrio sp. OA-2007 TaxID=529823 RepID=UPI000780376E|nr:hypothetical protein [Cellvibrio sp. OA-2007]
MTRLWKLALAVICSGCWAAATMATPVTCLPTTERVATLDSAVICLTGNDENIHSPAQVSTLFGGLWVKEGELTGNGTNDLFTVALTSGSWGGNNVAGTWSLDSSFWSTYGLAVITMHVGHGNGDPDYFAWSITPGATSGSFNYKDLDGRGGGLSNLFLFGSGSAITQLSESGMGFLWVIGLLAVMLARRRV